MAELKTKEQLVLQLAALNREELDTRAVELEIKVAANAKDDTVRAKIVAAEFPAVEDLEKTKVKILLPVSGKFFLSYSVGEEVAIEAKQAQELIEAKYAEAVK